MGEETAVRIALELFCLPLQLRRIRTQPLPQDIVVLLQIAAGDDEVARTAAAQVDRPPEMVRNAAQFFIEQVLLDPAADSYRRLGATVDASAQDLRRNMGLLLRWLHPDLDAASGRSLFARHVTEAWENLKTPDRRAAYDASLERARRNAPRTRRRRTLTARDSNCVRGLGPTHLGGPYAYFHPSSAQPHLVAEPSPRMGLIRRLFNRVFGTPQG